MIHKEVINSWKKLKILLGRKKEHCKKKGMSTISLNSLNYILSLNQNTTRSDMNIKLGKNTEENYGA